MDFKNNLKEPDICVKCDRYIEGKMHKLNSGSTLCEPCHQEEVELSQKIIKEVEKNLRVLREKEKMFKPQSFIQKYKKGEESQESSHVCIECDEEITGEFHEVCEGIYVCDPCYKEEEEMEEPKRICPRCNEEAEHFIVSNTQWDTEVCSKCHLIEVDRIMTRELERREKTDVERFLEHILELKMVRNIYDVDEYGDEVIIKFMDGTLFRLNRHR